MPTTPVYQLPYPDVTQQPHVPNDIKALAEEVETELVRVDAAAATLATNRNLRNLGGRIVTTNGVIHNDIGATETNITKLAFENTPVTVGRVYLFTIALSVQFSVAANSFAVRVRKDTPVSGPLVGDFAWISQVAGFTHDRTFTLPWKAAASEIDADFYVSVVRIAGAGVCDVNGNRRTTLWIDEVLNSSGWQEVA